VKQILNAYYTVFQKSGPLNMYKFLQKYTALFNYHLTA